MSPWKLIQGLVLCAAALSGQGTKLAFNLGWRKSSVNLEDAVDHLLLFWVSILQPGSPNDCLFRPALEFEEQELNVA